MTAISTTPTRAEVTRASAELDAIGLRIDGIEVQVLELRQRRAALDARVQQHQRAQPNATISYDATMVDALAADPSAGIDADAIAAKLAAERQSLRLWQEEDGLYREALAKIDGEIAARRAEIAVHAGEKRLAWRAFVLAAHAYLLGEFVTAMDALNVNVLDPLAMLAAEEEEQGVPIIKRGELRIAELSKITLERLRDGNWHEEVLYPRVVKRGETRPASMGSIEKFRAGLTG